MHVSPAHLIALLRARGIRVEVEELLRLHEALQAGMDWTPQRLEHVIVGVLATCPEDGPRIREALHDLRRALEPAVTGEVASRPRIRPIAGPPPLLRRRLVVGLGLGGAAAAAITVALLSRRRPEPDAVEPDAPETDAAQPDAAQPDLPRPDAPEPDVPATPATAAADGEAPAPRRPESPAKAREPPGESAGVAEPDPEPAPAPPSPLPPPPEPAPLEEESAWVTEERAAQAAYRDAQAARRERESAARLQEIAEIDRTRTSRRVSVPRFVAEETSWSRLIGAALLGPAAAAGALAWFAHRAWRRRVREVRRFGGPGLEVGSGPSLFWLAPRDPRWPPLLGAAAREALVWGVGQAASEEPTRSLDEDATVDATIEHGGMPQLRYRGLRRLRRVWLWHDQSAGGPIAARLCAEVQQTLHGYGLAVEVARFCGLPERLEREDGRVLALDALEDEREVSTVVILSDGSELLRQWERRDPDRRSREPQVRAVLGRLAAWPHLTVVHTGPRERLRALRALLDPLGIPCVPLEAFPLAVREREHLLQTLDAAASADHAWMWAALCALYPLPVPEALALALLRELELPCSPLSLAQLLAQSTTTAGVQFGPQTRARLIERLRRALDDGAGGLPRPMLQALAFWRAHTIADDPEWASDTSGRGVHRRLVVALLDLWTDPERAARELSALWKSPHMPAVREELARVRPGARPGAPEPGALHVPIDPAKLSPDARARLQAAGVPGLATDRAAPAIRWPWWLRALVASAALLLVAGMALLIVDARREREGDGARWALAIPAGGADEGPLLAHVAGEWREVGRWPLAAEVEVVTETVEVSCVAADGLRRCGAGGSDDVPARRIAVLDAERDSVDAVRFADGLLDRGLVDAAWIGGLPPWLVDRAVRSLPGRRGLEVWVFSSDPEFMTGPGDRAPRYPAIVGGSTGRVVAADFCGDAVCAVTEIGGVVRSLRGDRSGTRVTELPGHRSAVRAAAWSPDGRHLVTASEDRTARVWRLDGPGEPIVLAGHQRGVTSVAWSPDGRRIVTTSSDRTARIWSADGTAEPVLLQGHEDEVLAAAWSPDGARLVTGSADDTARVWRADGTGEAVVPHEGDVRAAAWSPDGQQIVTTSADRRVRIWRADGTAMHVGLVRASADVTAVAWSPDGQRIITGSTDDSAQVWSVKDVVSQTRLARERGMGHQEAAFRDLELARDDARFVTVDEAGEAALWATNGGAPHKLASDATLAAFSPTDGTLALGTTHGETQIYAVGRDGGATLLRQLEAHRDEISAIAHSADGKWMATGDRGGVIRIWDGRGVMTSELRQHRSPVTRLIFRDGGRRLYALGGQVFAFDLLGGRRKGKPLPLAMADEVTAIAVGGGLGEVVTGDRTGEVWLWTLAGGKASSARIAKLDGPVVALEFIHERRALIAVGATREVVGIDLGLIKPSKASQAPKRGLLGLGGVPKLLALDPIGRHAAVATTDGKIYVWDLGPLATSGQPLAIFDEHGGAAVRDLVITHDGNWLLSADADGTLRRHDLRPTAEDAADAPRAAAPTLLRHGDGPGLTAVAASATHMLTASEAGTVRVWTAEGRPAAPRADLDEASLARWRDWEDAPWSRMRVHPSTDWRHLLARFPADEPAPPPIAEDPEVALAAVAQDPRARLVTGIPGPVTAATGTGDGGLLLGTAAGQVVRWTAAGGVEAPDGSGHAAAVVAFASGAKHILSLAADGTARVWGDDGTRRGDLKTDGPVATAAATFDGAGLVVATRTGSVRAAIDSDGVGLPSWDIAFMSWDGPVDDLAGRSRAHVALLSAGVLHTCERLRVWVCRAHQLELVPQLLAVSPAGLAVASKGHLPVLGLRSIPESEVKSGSPTALDLRRRGPIGWPVALRFSPDGRRLAMAALDGTVRLVAVDDRGGADGQDCQWVLRHEAPLTDVAFSADGSFVATAAFDGEVRVFRATDGAGPIRLTGHRGPVRSVSFFANGAEQGLVSVSDDGSARVWAVPDAAAFDGADQADTLCSPRAAPPPGEAR